MLFDEPDLPPCDWAYFATPSRESFEYTAAYADEFGMIVRPAYNRNSIPIANVKRIRQAHRILMAYGSAGSYRPMFSCIVVPAPRPVPGFDALSFADAAQHERLQNSGYVSDPVFNKFTGISIKMLQDLEHITCRIRKPAGNNVIRTWIEVFGPPIPEAE
jgi:hypothetical protein